LKSWDLFKVLLGQIGFYRRKFIFFIGLIVLALIFNFIWQNSKNVEAAINFSEEEVSSSQVKMEVTLTQDGQVFINGKKNNQYLKFYDNYDELSIIVFNNPGSYISSFEGIVHLPAPAPKELRQMVYAVHGVGAYEYSLLDSQTLIYEASDISPQAVLTIVTDLPKGMVKPGILRRLGIAIQKFPLKGWLYVAIVLPLITIMIMSFMIIKRRADQFSLATTLLDKPPSLEPPAVVGVLLNGAVGAREIVATLINLAHRGYIMIVNKGPEGFSFGKKRLTDPEKTPGLNPFERALLSKIFLNPRFKSTLGDVEMRIGRHIFSRKIAQFYLEVYNSATRKGYFIQNPARVHLTYKYTGVGLFFLSFLGFIFGTFTGADPKYGLFFWVGGMLAASFIIRLSPFMPARSASGKEELKKWLAFRRFLLSKKTFQSAEVLQNQFEEYLSYAIVLGVEVEWANHFADEPFFKPDWYESAERAVTLESFVGEFFPFIGYVAENLARSHEPTVE